ncbi:NUDIX hydrolase [Nakamurella sp. GG22]
MRITDAVGDDGVASEGGRGVPEIRPAATVMLLRDAADDELEVFVLRRVAAMAFAPGMTVFPGGAVDPSDHADIPGWTDADTQRWSAALGAEPESARAFVIAAIRELFEETGVLLASALSGAVQSGALLADADRLAILHRERHFADVLASAGLRVRPDLLRPWANWITPPGRTRRYDTFFFAAALPDGQDARMLTSEADLGQWRTPAALLAESDIGAAALMPPTVAMLTDLVDFDTVADVMAAARVVTPVRVRASDFPGLNLRGGSPRTPPAERIR